MKFILDGAEHLQAFGDVSLYTKRGGYRAALRDFKAVHPKAVEVVHDVNGIVSMKFTASLANFIKTTCP